MATLISKASIDAYLKLEHNKMRYRTRVITTKEIRDAKCEPIDWNQEFWLSVRMPMLEPDIKIKLMDYDDIGSDELAGTISIPTKTLIDPAMSGKFMWINIWGAPKGVSSSKEKRAMNDNPDLATQYKGRVLVQIES